MTRCPRCGERGTFHHTLWVNCGVCGQALTLVSTIMYGPKASEGARGELRRMRWKETNELGWVCPACQKAERAGGG